MKISSKSCKTQMVLSRDNNIIACRCLWRKLGSLRWSSLIIHTCR